MIKKPSEEIEVDFDSIMVRRTEVLSQDEIDQLLTAIGPGDDTQTEVKSKRKKKNYLEFKELEKLSIEAAQESSNNFLQLQKEFESKLTDMKNAFEILYKEVAILKEENKTFKRQLKGASLFD
jgi:flagellar motor switch protein FliM